MKYLLTLLFSFFLFSCGNEKILLLPEIEHSNISEIKDVSAAYLFYDETKKDSIELNRKNLISTTNWLINVDKRLTLKQAIPYITFLQSKKKTSSHKNKKAKNYFTCNDISRNNLGFVEFTKVVFNEGSSWSNATKVSQIKFGLKLHVQIHSSDKITFISTINDSSFIQSNISSLNKDISDTIKNVSTQIEIILDLNKSLSFQDYISIKSILNQLNFENATLSNNEYIY